MPRTLAENATYIANTIKPAIKQAIEDKGVTVPSTDSFLDYADRIGEISGGGSGYQLKDLPTGSISTVSDAAPLPLNALKVSVEAWQDLHGYDHPWVGGDGKNKLPLTVDGIKSFNTSAMGYRWEGNSCAAYGITFTLLTDSGNNLIGIKATGTASNDATLYVYGSNTPTAAAIIYDNAMICTMGLSGSPSTYRGVIWKTVGEFLDDQPVSITAGDTLYGFGIRVHIGYAIPSSGIIFKPMVRLATESDDTFAPYSNICPISGWDSGEITVCDDIQSPTQTETYTQQFPTTIYGAEWDVVNGELGLKITDGFYSSYNGETLPGVWMSDRDVYQAGTTPTIGAEVKYKLATPIYITQTGLSIRMLQGVNNLYADCGEILEGEYFVDEGAIDVRKVDYQIGSSGSIKTTDGRVLSGFASMSGYHARPLDASGNWLDVDWSKDFEIGVTFKFTALPNYQGITGDGNANSYRKAPRLYYDNSEGKLALCVSSDGSTLAIDQYLNYSFVTDKWYFIKLKFVLSTMTFSVDISDDFDAFTNLYTGTMSNAPYHNSASLCFGGDAQQSNMASNTFLVDTFNTYIKGDGVNWGASTGVFPS
jgi:hypothetical protein